MLHQLRRRRWCGEITLLAALYVVYELVRGASHSSLSDPLANGARLLRLEQKVGISPEHALNDAFNAVPALALPACYFYATCHYLVTPIVLIWLWRAHQDRYRPVRSVLIVSTLIGLIGFWLLPTAPPRLLDGFTDTLAQWSHLGWWGGAGSVPRGFQRFTDQNGAMPSLHVGWAVWCGWAIVRYARRPWVRVLGVAYPLLTCFVVVGTANHYVADAVAGALVIAVAGALVAAVERARAWLAATLVIHGPGVIPRLRAPLAADRIRELAAETAEVKTGTVDSTDSTDFAEGRARSPEYQLADGANGSS